MKAYIFGGGEVYASRLCEVMTPPEGDDLVIVADSGYKNAREYGVEKIDALIGDFDSIGCDVESLPRTVSEILRVPAEKDLTDLQLAVELARERGADELVIVASTDGRVDHTLSSLAILEELWKEKGMTRTHAYIINGKNCVRYVNSTSCIIVRSKFKYFSLVAVDEKVKGVSVEGGKYPLKGKTLERRHQFAVSNEIVKNAAMISVKKGGIYIIESRDM